MLTSLDNIIKGIALASHNREVKKYLDELTYTSLPEELGKVLLPQLKGWLEKESLEKTFNQFCIEGPSQQKYWTQESFRKYIRSAHSEAAISDTTTQLLWRSFHFFAYHPIPCSEGQLDFNAFRRAALLIVFQCNDLLGTRELQSEWFWRNDASFFREAGLERIFRSTGITSTTICSREQQKQIDLVLSDAADVLSMVGPQSIKCGPSPEQLESVVRKLFAEGHAIMQREVRRKEVSTLLNLLLRLKVSNRKWGSWGTYHNSGHIVDASPADEELTKVLVNSLIEDENEHSDITSEQIHKAPELMPNFQLRFYQLWAVLFQPQMSISHEELSQVPEALPNYIDGAILLFAPYIKAEHRFHRMTAQSIEQIAIEKAEVCSDPRDLTIGRLVQALSSLASSGYVVLFTGDATATTPEKIIGAYFPGPLYAKDGERSFDTRSSSSHLLFQLKPEFCLLRCVKHGVPLIDLIQAKEGGSLAHISMTEASELLDVSYRIGEPQEYGSSLSIDPEKKTATLMSRDGKWCEYAGRKRSDELDEGWEVIIQNPRMDILMISGDENPPNAATAVTEDILNPEREMTRVEKLEGGASRDQDLRLEGEELLKRIQGFGPR